jgi:hypothetical protein
MRDLLLTTTFLLAIMQLSPPRQALSQEVHAKLLGGFHAPTAAGARVAFFFVGNSMCTGTLVGKNLVLTAAHCVHDEGDPNNYLVFVDGTRKAVASAWYDPGFDPDLPIVEVRPYDLGMIVLAENATKKAPIPVLVGRRPRAPERFFIAGYGLSERDIRRMKTYKEQFKIGEIQLKGTDGEMLYSTHRPTRSSLCGGDSGGPALKFHGDYIALAGVASTGTNSSRDGRCYLTGGGVSAHVDLQSPNSLSFLAAFEGVEYATWGDMALAKVADDMSPQLARAGRARSLSQLKKIVTPHLQALKRAAPKATAERQTLIAQAIEALTTATNSNSLGNAKKATKAAQRFLGQIRRMGIT